MSDFVARTLPNLQAADLLWWAFVQASVIAAAAYLLVVLVRQTTPAARVYISLLGLLLMSAVPLAALNVTEGWSWGQLLTGVESPLPVTAPPPVTDQPTNNPSRSIEPLTAWEQLLVRTSAVFVERVEATPTGVSRLRSDQPEQGSYWAALATAVLSVCVAIGLGRLFLGYRQIARLRHRAQTIQDADLAADLRECCEKIGLSQPIPVAETRQLGSAAIVGWRSPLLLLPTEWRRWTSQERRAVLAHEVAHVKRGDILSTAVGQLALAVNFYHPLAHVVLGRLRLDQELAADSLAAQAVGGQQQYIQTLAGLALRQPKVRAPGPCQAFLPSRRTFVRRLEMLRTLPTRRRWLQHCCTVAALSTLIVVATLASGLRSHVVMAQEHPKATTLVAQSTSSSGKRSLTGFLPAGLCETVVVVDVPAVLKSPAAKSIRQQSDLPDQFSIAGLQIEVEDVEQVMIVVLAPNGPRRTSDPLVMLRCRSAFEGEAPPSRFRKLDDHTIAIHSNDELLALLGIGAAAETWEQLLDKHADAHVRLASKTNWVRSLASGGGVEGPTLALSPLWENVELVSAGLSLGDSLDLSVQLDTSDSQRVAETLTALKFLAGNYLQGLPSQMKGSQNNSPSEVVMASVTSAAGGQILDSLKIKTLEQQVHVTASMSDAAYPMLAMAMPAITAARSAALRTQSMNNMKQLMLAMHNYHDTHRHLPPAVLVDPESGEERSWRVELLPFLDHGDLYEQYRKDEPWDSPANRQVLMNMPQVYAVAGSEGTRMTPYQAIVSPGGALTLTEEGQAPGFRDIIDGSSNTIMLIETKLQVAWTQPVDMSDTEGAPLLGTARNEPGVLVALADGAVRFVAEKVDKRVWKALLSRDGAESFTFP